MPVIRIGRTFPPRRTSIVSPSAMKLTLPDQKWQRGPPGTHGPVEAEAVEAAPPAASARIRQQRVRSMRFGTTGSAAGGVGACRPAARYGPSMGAPEEAGLPADEIDVEPE